MPNEDLHLTISPESMGSQSPLEHSPDVSDHPGSKMASDSGLCRLPLRFAEGARKPSHPGYLPLDVILDHFGQYEFPDDWGLLPGWEHMPFIWRPKKASYCHVRLRFNKKHQRKKRWFSRLRSSDVDINSLHRCNEIYKKACRRIRHAARTSDLDVYAIDPDLGRKVLIVDRDIFATKRIEVFYTGTARVQLRGEELTRCRLVVKERDYEFWLLTRRTNSLMEAVAKVIDDQSVEHNFRVTTTKFDEDILPLFYRSGLDTVRKSTDQILRKMKYRAGAGSPRYENYDKHKLELIAKIDAVLGRYLQHIERFPVPKDG